MLKYSPLLIESSVDTCDITTWPRSIDDVLPTFRKLRRPNGATELLERSNLYTCKSDEHCSSICNTTSSQRHPVENF